MRALYSLLLYLLVPLILLRTLFRSLKNPGYRRRLHERFGLNLPAPEKNGIWVHAVSVGESIAAVKLVKSLQAQYPNQPFIVTCGTPTGSDIIQNQLGDSVYHVYVPYDLPGAVKRFMAKVRPTVGIIMETELWPNLLHYAKQSGVRLLISNMRISDRSFAQYQNFSSLTRQALENIDLFAAQTDEDAKRVLQLGADRQKVKVVGNLKFDLGEDSPQKTNSQRYDRYELAKSRPIWLAGSTHEGEDKIILNVHAALLAEKPELLLILVPRHPERFPEVYQQSIALFETQKRSGLRTREALSDDTQVLLVDSMGELDQFISMSDWCFIGGSLVPVGGHNVLEACHAGVPVIFGNNMDNFRQVAKIVKQAHAGIEVKDQNALLAACKQLANSEANRIQMGQHGKALIAANQGALDKTLALLDPWLSAH